MMKKTLFDYLHDTLVLQITSGKIAYGEKLPAIRTLCQIYHVGIRTARDVMKALVEEGFVETIERSHVRVKYQIAPEGEESGSAQQVAQILERRQAVQALQKVKMQIIPHLFAEASKLCDEALIQMCREDIQGAHAMSTQGKRRLAAGILQRLTSAYHNDLLQELCVDLDLFAQVPVLPGYPSPYDEVSLEAEELNHLLDLIACQDYDGIFLFISKLYAGEIEPVKRYFDQLQAAYPDLKPGQVSFNWNAEKGRVYTYMEVARDIIQKIGDGVFEDGAYLPANSQLREQYGVSAYTVGKSMEILEETGLVIKRKQRGGYRINIQHARDKELHFSSATLQADFVTFLSAIHIVALISKGVALLGFDYLDDQITACMTRALDTKKPMILLNGLLAPLVQAQPYAQLKEIYAELNNLMMWGYYFAFVRQEEAYIATLLEQSRIALAHAKKRDKAAFADIVQKNYYNVFRLTQEALISYGITDAQKLKLP